MIIYIALFLAFWLGWTGHYIFTKWLRAQLRDTNK